jgi:acetolactate synthase-1/2/3 large subunit
VDADESSGTTVAGRLLDQLTQAGVEVVFGLPGVHNLPFWQAAAQSPTTRPRIIGVRHEQAAMYAADGLARATGGVGVALTTTGPGAANAVAAFGEADQCASPALLIASEPPLGPRRVSGSDSGLLHSMVDQQALFAAPFGAFTMSLPTPLEASHLLPTVLSVLTDLPAPGYLGIPADVLAAPADTHETELPDLWSRRPDLAPAVAEPVDVARLAALLDGRRVALWVGPEAVYEQCGPLLAALAERLGAPVVTTYGARGLLGEHRLLIDAPPHEPEVAAAIAAAEVLLVVGDPLHGMTTRNWTMPVPGRLAVITRYAGLSLGDYDFAVRLETAVRTTLESLLAQLGPGGAAPWAPPGVAARVRARLLADPSTAAAMRLVAAVEQSWPAAAAVVADMCVAGYWVGGYASQPRARRLQYPVGWGTLGYALPAAIGPAAAGLPTLAIVGDGGAAMAVGELATYRQERLPVTVLLVDDGGYGMLRFDQDAAGHHRAGVELIGPRWPLLADAYGVRHWSVREVGDLPAALAEAHRHNLTGQPALVHLPVALTPPRTTSPRWHEPA